MRFFRFSRTSHKETVTCSTAHGHFYSPVVDPSALRERQSLLWPEKPEVLGIDFNPGFHRQVLEDFFPKHLPHYDYPEEKPESDTQFFTRNSQFSWLDSRALFVLLREWQPAHMIEIGSGFSSLLAADVNHRFLEDRMELTCVEPYPREFLKKNIPGLSQVIEEKVQDLPLSCFDKLERGDILFIDSSHVAKTGSDVNHLFFEVLPRLAKGVRIHVHDIFLPHEYPKEWVIEQNRSWNEQYLLRALLMYSTAFRVLFGCKYAETFFPQEVQTALNLPTGRVFGGGSFWFEKTG